MTLPAITQTFARQLLPLLPELVGDTAPALQTQLEPLVQAPPCPDNQAQILALLQPHPPALDWLTEKSNLVQIGAAPTATPDRGYSPLAGDRAIDSEPEIRYICPIDGCTEDYFAQSSREAAPLCEKHGVVMVREAKFGEGESRIV